MRATRMADVGPAAGSPQLVGRDGLLARLARVIDGAAAGAAATVVVSGRAGIGKTSLVRAAATEAESGGAYVGWGTCVDIEGAPGYWPWSQALAALITAVGAGHAIELAGDDAALLAAITPPMGTGPTDEVSDRTRLLLWDATVRWLGALGQEAPVLVVLDDLQWADDSSLALLDFVSRAPRQARICVIGAYRDDELSARTRRHMDAVVGRAEHAPVEGLDADAVEVLVERITGHADPERAASIHRRTGGHPLFVRELALLPDRPDDGDRIPSAVLEAIGRRTDRLPSTTVDVLEVAALTGPHLMPDVVAHALGLTSVEVADRAQPAVTAGLLLADSGRLRFEHDLVRESLRSRIDETRRPRMHQAIGAALEDRVTRSAPATAADLARHFTHAVSIDGPQRAVRWALAAAQADRSAVAFAEAAGHLRRLRAAVADAGVVLEDRALIDVLLAEADALARAGSTLDARGLLRLAGEVADRSADTAAIAQVVLATASLGARFAVRRDELISELDRALDLLAGSSPAVEAQLAATLARELAHSVSEDRPRAGPLSRRALELSRRTGDPTVLATCLLARHDVMWTPGRAAEREEVAREIIAVAERDGDDERHAEGLLLLANALLEQGSGAFRAALDSCLALLDRLGQPRHRYTADTRRACLELLRGRLDDAAAAIESAARIGDRIREPDTGNVRMSQRLELVRARGDIDKLCDFAAEAVAHWTGAPVHAHAVAAGFCARAGDLATARHHLAVVSDLGGWESDRSYLWSVYVRELASAAVSLAEHDLCRRLLDELKPLAACCGVNGAVVAFAGSHADTAGRLAAALGETELAAALLRQACATYQRLGATQWQAEAEDRLRALASPEPGGPAVASSLRRDGGLWRISFAGRDAVVAHRKGLGDLAALLARPGRDVHVLDLAGSADRSGAAGDVVDHIALGAYRRRVAQLDDEITEADRHDEQRLARLRAERQAVLDELGRATRLGHAPRGFANTSTERARKAVSARIRDAISSIETVHPELAAHLGRSIVTGTYCRYRPDAATPWQVSTTSRHG